MIYPVPRPKDLQQRNNLLEINSKYQSATHVFWFREGLNITASTHSHHIPSITPSHVLNVSHMWQLYLFPDKYVGDPACSVTIKYASEIVIIKSLDSVLLLLSQHPWFASIHQHGENTASKKLKFKFQGVCCTRLPPQFFSEELQLLNIACNTRIFGTSQKIAWNSTKI